MKPKTTFPPGLDEPCRNLYLALNALPGIQTIDSCCGHGGQPFRMFFLARSLASLPAVLFHIDRCHVRTDSRWKCEVYTDCAMSPVHFMIESGSMGEEAYKEADMIAAAIQEYVEFENRTKLKAKGGVGA